MINTRFLSLYFALALSYAGAQRVDPSLYSGMQWRLLGPFRAGKSTSVAGVPGNPAIYYTGTAGSGVWKTVSGGQVWDCVSDSVKLTGIGAVAVAPSSPDTVYAGASGTGPTAGLYRSIDGGGHWDLVALKGHAVSSIVIDPRNVNTVLAAAGDSGVVLSNDGGKTWKSTLPDVQVGGVWLVMDPDNPRNIYAGTRPIAAGGRGGGPGGGGRAANVPMPVQATDSQIYRSADEGATWIKTSPNGLPGGNFGTISLAVAPGTQGQRVYDYIAQGVYRSDDAGEHWVRATDDPRLIGGGQFHDIIVNPRDPNVLFATQTSLYKSLDAGKTWASFTGAPSGADFNYLWIDPTNDRSMALAVDQGTEISMDGGRSWTTWFNQPTGQFYNLATDHGFPFFIYSAQQDSGTIATPIFGRGGQITYRDWYTTNGFETARIVPDPADSNFLYATGWYGSVLRINKITGQTQQVFVRTPKYRESGNAPPMGFSPGDPNTFYLGTQYLLTTKDKGMSWQNASPDLTAGASVPESVAPQSGGGGRGPVPPAISALAFSPADSQTIWAGTSTGLLQLTRDRGTNWANVASPEFPKPGTILAVEASATDPARAFAVVGQGGGGRGGPNAVPSRIYRTDDFGQHWKPLSEGLPASPARVVREDPGNRNLVFAALDSGVFVSFNGGDQWQSLQLNLPVALGRDLAIEQNTLVVATFGRALWAIDNISPLRDLASDATQIASSSVYLFAPAPAIRMQWDTYTDTPLNPDFAAAANPPDGAVIDYYLKSPVTGDISLEIYDTAGKLVRSYSSKGQSTLGYKVNVPDYWLAPAPLLAKAAGHHRFVWDLRYPEPDQLFYTYFGVRVDYFEYTLADHAIPHNTPWHEPQGPMVVPGQYEVRLKVGGETFRRPLNVKLDPRLNVSTLDLQRQLALAQKISTAMAVTYEGHSQVVGVRKQLAALNTATKVAEVLEALKALDLKVQAVAEGSAVQPPAISPPAMGPMNRELTRLMIAVGQSDTPPSGSLIEAFASMCQDTRTVLSGWNDLRGNDLPRLNALLSRQSLTPLAIPSQAINAPDCGN